MASLRGVSALHDELQKAKDSLLNVDEDIKKLTGRTPGISRSQSNTSDGENRSRGRLFAVARRGIQTSTFSPGGRRLSVGSYNRSSFDGPRRRRDSGDERDDFDKPAISSTVTTAQGKSRKELLTEQTKDKEGMARNKRMFGFLLGTLSRFKQENKDADKAVLKRDEIEKKLERKNEEEKAEVLAEREHLFNKRRQQQSKMRRLEDKLEMVNLHGEWERHHTDLMQFIRTRNKPHIFYMPKKLNTAMERKLEESQNALRNEMKNKRQQLEEEIAALMQDDDEEPIKTSTKRSKRSLLPDHNDHDDNLSDEDEVELSDIPIKQEPHDEEMVDDSEADRSATGEDKENDYGSRRKRHRSEDEVMAKKAKQEDNDGDVEMSDNRRVERRESRDSREGEGVRNSDNGDQQMDRGDEKGGEDKQEDSSSKGQGRDVSEERGTHDNDQGREGTRQDKSRERSSSSEHSRNGRDDSRERSKQEKSRNMERIKRERSDSTERSRRERSDSRERSRRDKSDSRERRIRIKSDSRERSRKGRSRSRERSKRDRSRSRERSRREKGRSRERSRRDRSRSRERSRRDKSRSKERSRRERSRSNDRHRKNRSRERSVERRERSRERRRPSNRSRSKSSDSDL